MHETMGVITALCSLLIFRRPLINLFLLLPNHRLYFNDEPEIIFHSGMKKIYKERWLQDGDISLVRGSQEKKHKNDFLRMFSKWVTAR